MNEYTYEVISDNAINPFIKRTDVDGNESWIPVDPGNSDYAAYLESLNDNTKTE